jgi:hypothetical protein
MNRNLYNDVEVIINNWEPEVYSNELAYRDDLFSFLRSELNKPSAFGTPQERVNVTKEDGRGLCDIAINRRIGIELKKDLSRKSEMDRLVGQVVGYKGDYEDIIIVLVGISTDEVNDQLENSLQSLRSQGGITLRQEVSIKVINKADEEYTDEGSDEANNEEKSEEDFEEVEEERDPTGINRMAENFKKNSEEYGKR